MATILIVDDEARVREVMTRWIQGAGHETLEAADAEEALASMRADASAVAFCDVQMPGRDGIWLTRELRRLYPHVAVVLATGVSTVPPAVSMQCGVLAYLVKPFNRDAVLTALGTALKWHEESVVGGARASDGGDVLDRWLQELDE